MSTNTSTTTEEINYNDFKTICRTCLFNYDLKPIEQDNTIKEVLHKLIGDFETNDELPQQVCGNCFEKINEIHAFVSRCRQTRSSLINCLNKHKNNEINLEENIKTEIIEVKQEVFNEDEISYGPDPLQQFPEDFEEPTTVKIENNELNCKELNLKNRKTYKCEICGETFQYSKIYQKHKNVHIIKAPLECDVCSKLFTKSAYLLAHKKIHSRNYQCNICNKTFKDSGNLSNHRQTHKDERPHECRVCLKAFKRRRHLETHERIHSGERPAKCDVCSKTFKSFANLAAHLRTHSTERPYKCGVCEKGFKFLYTMQQHVRIHSGERPCKCDCCGMAFIEPSSLRKHKLALHN